MFGTSVCERVSKGAKAIISAQAIHNKLCCLIKLCLIIFSQKCLGAYEDLNLSFDCAFKASPDNFKVSITRIIN